MYNFAKLKLKNLASKSNFLYKTLRIVKRIIILMIRIPTRAMNKAKVLMSPIVYGIGFFGLWILFILIALYARFFSKDRFDVGLGPQPLINNLYHKRALELYGYSAKTFVINTFFITSDFDYRFGEIDASNLVKALKTYTHTVCNYKILYTYFNGTMLYVKQKAPVFVQNLIFYTEPWLYKLAKMKLVVMPYGGDVHDLSHCYNLSMKNSIIKDYPVFQKQYRDYIRLATDTWTKNADHVISGCDWVWFNYHWDTLLSGHFSIDTHTIKPGKEKKYKKGDLIKIFHGPNHVTIKGSKHFIKAIDELKAEGYNVELVLVQKIPNSEVLKLIAECDIVADQLIIGWYAMTAIEGMALGKPILCYLHQDLLDLYCEQEVLKEEDISIINCNFRTVKEKIKHLLDHPELINDLGKKSRSFVEKYHSLEYIGKIFDTINRDLGVVPSSKKDSVT